MKKLIFAALLMLSTSGWAATVEVKDAYVRLMPPSQKVTGAFMTLVNNTDSARSAVSAKSSVSKVSELHTHINNNGVMQMRQVEKIEVPAGGSTELKPGGYHVMLINLTQPLELGQMVDITLNFDDGSSAEFQAEVKSVMAGMKMGEGKGHMDKKKMDPGQMKPVPQ